MSLTIKARLLEELQSSLGQEVVDYITELETKLATIIAAQVVPAAYHVIWEDIGEGEGESLYYGNNSKSHMQSAVDYANAMINPRPSKVINLYSTPPAVLTDATRWRAMLSSARIRILGSAGFSSAPSDYKSHADYRHFGMEIWTMYGKPGEYDFSENNAYGKEVLTRYADAILNAQLKNEPTISA